MLQTFSVIKGEIMNQVEAIEKFLTWLKSCPFTCTISSMQGSFIHVKFFLKPTMSKEEHMSRGDL